MAREKAQVVREPRKIAAMASPVRVRLLAVVGAAEPLSVAELAAQVGMAPPSLYYHVRALVAAGLLQERGRRRAGKRWEVLYGSAGEVVAHPNQRSPAFLSSLGRVYQAVLRDVARSLKRALDHERRQGQGPRQATALRHRRMRLRADAQAELRARLEDLDTFLQHADDPEGEAYDVTTILSRCVPRPGRRTQ